MTRTYEQFCRDFFLWADRVDAGGAGGSGGTHGLAQTMREIKLYWDQMDDTIRNRVKRYFDVTTVDGELLVNM